MTHMESLAAFLRQHSPLSDTEITLNSLSDAPFSAGLFAQPSGSGVPYVDGREKRTLAAVFAMRLPHGAGGSMESENQAVLAGVRAFIRARSLAGNLPTLSGATAVSLTAGDGYLLAAGMRDGRYQMTITMTYITD